MSIGNLNQSFIPSTRLKRKRGELQMNQEETFLNYRIERINTDKTLLKIFNLNAKKAWKAQIAYYSFKNETQREEYINRFKAQKQSWEEMKAERKAERMAVTADESLIGRVFYDSWGYDMTIVDYIKVIGVTKKQAICVSIGREVQNDDGRGDGKAFPAKDVIISKPFKLSVRQYNNQPHLVGKYYFCMNSDSTRHGRFSPYTYGGNYYNTWD